jgi:hypothetical protein
MQHALNIYLSYIFQKYQTSTPIYTTPNLMHFTNITLHHFSPWKLCSPNIFTFGRDVIYIYIYIYISFL